MFISRYVYIYNIHIYVYICVRYIYICVCVCVYISLSLIQGFPGGSAIKNPPAMQEMQEMWVQSLGWEDPLEKEMETPVFLPEKPHGWRRLVGYSPWGCKESDMTEWLSPLAYVSLRAWPPNEKSQIYHIYAWRPLLHKFWGLGYLATLDINSWKQKVKFSSIIKNVSFPAIFVFSFVSWFLFVSSDPAQFL